MGTTQVPRWESNLRPRRVGSRARWADPTWPTAHRLSIPGVGLMSWPLTDLGLCARQWHGAWREGTTSVSTLQWTWLSLGDVRTLARRGSSQLAGRANARRRRPTHQRRRAITEQAMASRSRNHVTFPAAQGSPRHKANRGRRCYQGQRAAPGCALVCPAPCTCEAREHDGTSQSPRRPKILASVLGLEARREQGDNR